MKRRAQQFFPDGLVVRSHESATMGNIRSGRVVLGLPNNQTIDRGSPLVRAVHEGTGRFDTRHYPLSTPEQR